MSEYDNCPGGLEDEGVIENKDEGFGYRSCIIPAIPHDEECSVNEDTSQSKPGWIYCEADDYVQQQNPQLSDYNVIINDSARQAISRGNECYLRCCKVPDRPED